jgi:hypothetical protein
MFKSPDSSPCPAKYAETWQSGYYSLIIKVEKRIMGSDVILIMRKNRIFS